jgi:hypothetical protein
MEDQQEEDDENNDEEEEAETNEGRKCRQRQGRRLCSQSLPLELSRSRSATNRQQPRKTPSPIFGGQKKQKGFGEQFHENLSHPIGWFYLF